MTFAIECKYRRKDAPEIIAIFDKELDATSYSRMHNGEGGCILNVIECNRKESLEYEVRTIYSHGSISPYTYTICSYGSVSYTYGPVSYPTGILFRFECEASSFAYRKARWKGGYLIVVHQPFSEAVV